jgi:hypothetical protein
MNDWKIILILTFVITANVFGQVSDDFSDNDFTNNPVWNGDNGKFIINTGKLKLQAPVVSESAFLSTPSTAIHNASWEFFVQMDFTPSSTNYVKIYLTSDRSNLNGALNGYFIKAGNTSRDVSLYRQNGTNETKIIDGLDDRVNATIVKIKIKTTRNAAGLWQVYSDVGHTGTYTLEGSFTDGVNTTSAYFGVACVYTATRSDKFWFDDFAVTGTIVPDTTPPTIQSVSAIDAQSIKIVWSEQLNSASAQLRENFSIGPQGSPSTAVLQSDGFTVILALDKPLVNGTASALTVSGIKDLAGNVMATFSTSVLYFKPSSLNMKDVIITEMFPDPSPQVGLPAAEFVEILNRSVNPINLSGWKLSDGSSSGILPSQIIMPGEYWILTTTSSVSLFSGMGKTIGLSNFPTLNNSSDTLTLKSSDDLLLDSLNYNTSWYHDEDKMDGGWTLELIDPQNTCAEETNWTSSENKNGGTPGRQNSVYANKPDLTAPEIVSVFPDSLSHIKLLFNEKLDPGSLDVSNFLLDPPREISKCVFADRTRRSIVIQTKKPLEKETAFALSIANVVDCSHNAMATVSFTFGLPEEADSLDVVINEILFNPRSGGVDFVEILNRSSKYINLKGWKLGNYADGSPVNAKDVFPENHLLAPNALAAFTSNPEIVETQYSNSDPKSVFNSAMPSLPDDEGSVSITNFKGRLIDAVSYSQNWQSQFINDNEGVSLERIDAAASSNDPNNWTSASSVSGFATPGLPNSQQRETREAAASDVTVVPEIFTPGSPPSPFVQIVYTDAFHGSVANVSVYDREGHMLKNIANNEILGPGNFFRWDGDRDDGTHARMGYYYIWFEVFDNSGAVMTVRKRVIVTAVD